jgi:hypothetical protein
MSGRPRNTNAFSLGIIQFCKHAHAQTSCDGSASFFLLFFEWSGSSWGCLSMSTRTLSAAHTHLDERHDAALR